MALRAFGRMCAGHPGAQVLRVDRRLHPRLALHLPADVDLQAGVRRVGPLDRPPQVLLETCPLLGLASAAVPHLGLRIWCATFVCVQFYEIGLSPGFIQLLKAGFLEEIDRMSRIQRLI